ncbi:MAG TPA: MFS transporter [Burkholderiaceae bacterium]|nr:MFS transporter [Burkholderiaceae bacterium]
MKIQASTVFEPMSAIERRASISLAALFGLRMLGLFLILPVFAVHARSLPGGDSAWLVGLALGIYGLTQGVLQIPCGMASDRFGRKPVIFVGLSIFALGSFVAAAAPTLGWTIVGRALQGAGAISAAVTAMIADATREHQRSKAMAMVGASIGLTFALSLVLGPTLYRLIGMSGLFALIGALAVAAIGLVRFVVPDVPMPQHATRVAFRTVLLDRQLLRLDFGIFALHVVQMAMFVVVPVLLVERAELALSSHWKVYLPAVLASFAAMVPLLNWAERVGGVRTLFIACVLGLAGVGLALPYGRGVLVWAVLLFAFFVAFNVLEALLPTLVSKLAPPSEKGAALGVYNTVQALGLFVGGAAGGWLTTRLGADAVFHAVVVLALAWFVVCRGMRTEVK